MLTLAIALIALWGLGLTTGYLMGGLLHVFLAGAVIMISIWYTGQFARRTPR